MPRHRSAGLRKRCTCHRRNWTKCPHPWHFAFKWKGVHHRFSLDKEVARAITNKTEAQAEADRIRQLIRTGQFRAIPPEIETRAVPTFEAFAEVWRERRGSQLVRPRDNDYRLAKINAFVLPGHEGRRFGEMPLDRIRTDDIEVFQDTRKAAGLSAYTVNHDLKLLRKMFNWAVRKGYLERTPFKIGTEPAIALDKEIPRDRRFESDDDERMLLEAANPHLRGVIIALLDTACRLGEILSLQWRNVNLERRELTIEAVKAKSRVMRIVPISSRLLATLEMRKLDDAGRPFARDAYVFGTPLGKRVKSIRSAWETARETAGLKDFQLRDLRHEAGSRFDEAGVSTNCVSKLLGHASLSTTTRYLNIQRRGLQLAMQKLEEHRAQRDSVAQTLHTNAEETPASVPQKNDLPSSKRLPS